ncbi:MAG: hypothetical protein ACK41C_13075 [Phenylobacterium sp.]|uniref:hypothetical protein n=1 Tax=Phenylobacterium sp. TaxID=1871053 RepID=UPI00391A9C8F
MKSFVPALGVAALALAAIACSPRDTTAPEPQGESVGAAMPDTSQPTATPNAPGGVAAPDAGATGVVPADGSPPPVQSEPAPPR